MSEKDTVLTNLVNNNIDFTTGNDFLEGDIKTKFGQLQGSLRAHQINTNFNELMSLAQIYQFKLAYNRKEPKVLEIAPNFKEFCEKAGIIYNTVRKKLNYLHELGLDFLKQAEQLSLPMSSVRDVSRLPQAQREKAIRAVLSDDATGEEVKELIRELVARDTKRTDILNEVSMKEKVELINERDDALSIGKTDRSLLNDANIKLRDLRHRNKELLESKKPEEQIQAVQNIRGQLELTFDLLKDAGGNINDPSFKTERASILVMVEGITDLLK